MTYRFKVWVRVCDTFAVYGAQSREAAEYLARQMQADEHCIEESPHSNTYYYEVKT